VLHRFPDGDELGIHFPASDFNIKLVLKYKSRVLAENLPLDLFNE
jgi:hypothetical protein